MKKNEKRTHTHTQIYINKHNIYMNMYTQMKIIVSLKMNVSEISSFFSTSIQNCLTETLRYPQEPYQDYQNCLYLYMCCFCIPFSCVPWAISCTMECNWTRCNHFYCKSSRSSFCAFNSIAHQSQSTTSKQHISIHKIDEIIKYIDDINCVFGVNVSEIFSFFSTSTQN